MRIFFVISVFIFVATLFGNPLCAQSNEKTEDDATVESDDRVQQPDQTTDSSSETITPASTSALTDQEMPAEEFPDGLPRPHPSVKTRMLFVDPPTLGSVPRIATISSLELPTGHAIKVIMSFRHLGLEAAAKFGFTLDRVAGALRYPADFNYYIQNFTASSLSQYVEPHKEASIVYSFNPAQQLSGRPYGLTLRIFYHDFEAHTYVSTVMNETVQLVDYEPPASAASMRFLFFTLDPEAFFLYMVTLCVLGLLLLGLYQLWQTYAPRSMRGKSISSLFAKGALAGGGMNAAAASLGGKMAASAEGMRGSASNHHAGSNAALKAQMAAKEEELLNAEAEAARAKGIDVDWIPREVLLREARKSPPRQSVKQRKLLRATSDASD